MDFIYRKYDRGTTTYTAGYQPGARGLPAVADLHRPTTYTDPVTGIRRRTTRSARAARVRRARRDHDDQPELPDLPRRVIPTAQQAVQQPLADERLATLQTNPDYQPLGSYTNPTGVEFTDGRSTIARYLFKVSGSYALPWDITASAT